MRICVCAVRLLSTRQANAPHTSPSSPKAGGVKTTSYTASERAVVAPHAAHKASLPKHPNKPTCHSVSLSQTQSLCKQTSKHTSIQSIVGRNLISHTMLLPPHQQAHRSSPWTVAASAAQPPLLNSGVKRLGRGRGQQTAGCSKARLC